MAPYYTSGDDYSRSRRRTLTWPTMLHTLRAFLQEPPCIVEQQVRWALDHKIYEDVDVCEYLQLSSDRVRPRSPLEDVFVSQS